MILRCSHCRTRFAADDAHRGRTFRCRVCASPIKTDDVALADTVFAPSSAPPASTSARSASVRPSAAPAQSSAPAAVVRRNNERSKRDLFSGEVELSAKVVERENVSPFTAARNENSVLFSLDQLSKPPVRAQESVAPVASSSAAAPAKKDDSGLIDLNKMMNEEKLSAKSVRPAPISEAPLGYAREVAHTPLPTVLEGQANPFAKKKNKGVFIGAGAAAVAAVIALGVVATNREDARVRAAAAAAAAPPAPPPVTATAEPTPPPPPVVAATEPAKTETKAEAKSTHRAKGHKAPGKAVKTTSASVPAAPPPPKKAADPCGCKGDLMCNIKCSSK